MSMIGKSGLAAALLAAALMPTQGVRAETTLNGQISQIINALHNGGHVSPSGFTFSVDTAGGTAPLFSGIAGVRGFTDVQALNGAVGDGAGAGGDYVFTHSVLGSYFDQREAAASAASYEAAAAPASQVVAPAAPTSPLPEPAAWAMMIAGLGLAGVTLRRSHVTVSFV